MAVFRQMIGLILALFLVTPRIAISNSLRADLKSAFSIILKTQEPLDERMSLEYRAFDVRDGKRIRILINWMVEEELFSTIRDHIRDLKKKSPALFAKLKKGNLKERYLVRFYGESLLLFAMLRNDQSELLNDQLAQWRQSWMQVDFRRLNSSERDEWGRYLLQILSAAFRAAGPWSVEELERTQSYLESQAGFQPGKRLENFRWLIHYAIKDNQGYDRRFADRTLTLIVLSGLVGFFSPFITGLIVPSYYLDVDSLMGALPYYLQILAKSTYVGALGLASYRFSNKFTDKIANSVIPSTRYMYSYMLEDGFPSCEDMLKEGR